MASFPLCCPSRATHLTGQYAHNHGVLHNGGDFGGYRALDHANTLPVWLQREGYRTMHVGRYLNGYAFADGIPPGWSDWHTSPHAYAFNYSNWRVNENGSLVSYPRPDHPGEYLTDFHARRASELIEDAAPGERPFFLQLWFVAPHRGAPRDADDPPTVGTPSPAPRHRDSFAGAAMPRTPNFDEAEHAATSPRWWPTGRGCRPNAWPGSRRTGARSSRALQAVDDGVARVIDTLERTGELANTLVVFTSDNGFMHGEHRAQAEKVLLYEESIRVPLLMRGPGIPRRFRDPRPVANIDVVPTIADATGVTPSRVLDGRSLLDQLADRRAWWGRDILIENGNGANNVPAYRAIRTNRFIYAEHQTTGEFELYDLETDPFQLRSLDGHPAYAAVQRRHGGAPAPAAQLRRPRLPEAAGAQAGAALAGPAAGQRRLPARRPARCASAAATAAGWSAPRSRSGAGAWHRRCRGPDLAAHPAPARAPRAAATSSACGPSCDDGRRFTLDRRLRACR